MSTSSGPPAILGGSSSSSGDHHHHHQHQADNEVMDLRKSYEGQLNKFTNVVKGWQYRWMVLNPESGYLHYYLLEDAHHLPGGRPPRGSQYLAGTVVVPSDEDSLMFCVNFASGEVYKLRAPNVRERQVWVNRIRAVAQMHDDALAQNAAASVAIREHYLPPPTPPGSRSHLSQNGEPSDALQHLSLSVLDALGSVHDILHQSDLRHQALAKAIEKTGRHALDEDLLILKATSQTALLCMENALTIIQDFREFSTINPSSSTGHISKKFSLHSPLSASPKKLQNFVLNNNGAAAAAAASSTSPTKSSSSTSSSFKRHKEQETSSTSGSVSAASNTTATTSNTSASGS